MMSSSAYEKISWIIYEIDNPRNDGWVREHYIDMLREIKKRIDKKLREVDNNVV